MAEMLQRLFTEGRRARQPRIQYQPFEGFGGPDPGMRGLMPANALDSQAMTDMAQGIDITSIEPTRLQADQINPAAFQQGAEDQEDGGEGEDVGGTPVQQASMIREVGCPGGVCPTDRGMSMGMPMGMPQGFALGPGETLVPGSVREMAAPPIAAQSQMATAAPAGTATQAVPTGGYDANWHLSVARQADADMQAALAARDPYGVKANLERFKMSMMAGQEALMLNLTKELADQNYKLAERGLKIKSGEARWEAQDKIRTDRNIPVDDRVEQVVNLEVAYYQKAGIAFPAQNVDQMRAWERAKITASDVGSFMKNYVRLTATPPEKRYKGWEDDVALLEGRMGELLNQEYGGLPKDEAGRRMRSELAPVYEDAYGAFFKGQGLGDTAPDAQAAALRAITIQHSNLQSPGYESLRRQQGARAQGGGDDEQEPASVGYPIYGGMR